MYKSSMNIYISGDNQMMRMLSIEAIVQEENFNIQNEDHHKTLDFIGFVKGIYMLQLTTVYCWKKLLLSNPNFISFINYLI